MTLPSRSFATWSGNRPATYAASLALAVQGVDASWVVMLAWAYVVLRVVHSLVQTTLNHIPIRFVLFASSALCGLALSLEALHATLA